MSLNKCSLKTLNIPCALEDLFVRSHLLPLLHKQVVTFLKWASVLLAHLLMHLYCGHIWPYMACFLKQYVVLAFLFRRFTLILSQCTCLLQLDFLKFCYILNNIKLLLDTDLVNQFNCYIIVIVKIFNNLCSMSAASPSEWDTEQQE